MNFENWTARELTKFRHDPEFETEMALLEITSLLAERMDALGWRKADLARHLGVSRPFVSKLLNGSHNMTIGTLIRTTNVLGLRLQVGMLPRHIAEFLEGDAEFVGKAEPIFDYEGVSEGEQIPLAA
jgi:transcriptional regulator with XRE-family HTH domain